MTTLDAAHTIEYDGDTYETPSIIENDDGKEHDTSVMVQGRRPSAYITENASNPPN